MFLWVAFAASYLLGYVSLELSGFLPGDSAQLDLPDPEQLAAAYPYLAAAAPHLMDYDADADFDTGLKALLEGLARHASASDGALPERQPRALGERRDARAPRVARPPCGRVTDLRLTSPWEETHESEA